MRINCYKLKASTGRETCEAGPSPRTGEQACRASLDHDMRVSKRNFLVARAMWICICKMRNIHRRSMCVYIDLYILTYTRVSWLHRTKWARSAAEQNTHRHTWTCVRECKERSANEARPLLKSLVRAFGFFWHKRVISGEYSFLCILEQTSICLCTWRSRACY